MDRIKKLNPSIGGFSGLYPFGDSYLVAGTDGVGTKLKLAFDMDKHDTVGIDLVAMSVNDIVCCGAKPMFFLDYFATGVLEVNKAEDVVKGIVEGCKRSDCILMGGETAEMPGMYPQGEYDLGGFAVGSVKKEAVIDGSKVSQMRWSDVLVNPHVTSRITDATVVMLIYPFQLVTARHHSMLLPLLVLMHTAEADVSCVLP